MRSMFLLVNSIRASNNLTPSSVSASSDASPPSMSKSKVAKMGRMCALEDGLSFMRPSKSPVTVSVI